MKYKVCVIGGGRWGKNHIRTLHQLGCLAGIAESHDDTLNTLKKEYPDVQLFSDYRDAVKDNFDGFTIATPAETHFEIARTVIQNKKHVLVEKPITLKAMEASRLNELADENGVNLMVGHVLLFHPAIQKISELIRAGKIGKLQYLYSNRLNLGKVRKEENILWSFAPHDISIFQYLIEDMPVDVYSTGGGFIQPGIHDSTLTVLKYLNNIVGHIFVSWLHPFKEHRLVIIGSEGMLSFEDSSEQKEVLFYQKKYDCVEGEPIKMDGATESIPYERDMPLTREIQYFVDHLDGTPLEINNGQAAADVLEILERATESLMKGN